MSQETGQLQRRHVPHTMAARASSTSLAQIASITHWQLGSLAGVVWRDIYTMAPPIITAIVVLLLMRWRINIRSLGESEAKTLGMDIGWIGLAIPHLGRMHDFRSRKSFVCLPAGQAAVPGGVRAREPEKRLTKEGPSISQALTEQHIQRLHRDFILSLVRHFNLGYHVSVESSDVADTLPPKDPDGWDDYPHGNYKKACAAYREQKQPLTVRYNCSKNLLNVKYDISILRSSK